MSSPVRVKTEAEEEAWQEVYDTRPPPEQIFRESHEKFGPSFGVKDLRIYYGGQWRQSPLIPNYWCYKDYEGGQHLDLPAVDGDTCGGPTIAEFVHEKIPNPFNYEISIGTEPPLYTVGGLRMEMTDDVEFKLFWHDGDEDEDGWLALYMDILVIVPEAAILEAEEEIRQTTEEARKAREEEEARVAREAEEARVAREAEEAAKAAKEAEEVDSDADMGGDEADASSFEFKKRLKKKAGKRPMRKESLADLKRKSKSLGKMDINNLSEEELDDDYIGDVNLDADVEAPFEEGNVGGVNVGEVDLDADVEENVEKEGEESNEEEENEEESNEEESNEEETSSDDDLSEADAYISPAAESSDEDYVPNVADHELDEVFLPGNFEAEGAEEEEETIYDELLQQSEDVFAEEPEEVAMPSVPELPQKGAIWPTVEDCKEWLKDYAVATNMEFRYKKADSGRIRCICLQEHKRREKEKKAKDQDEDLDPKDKPEEEVLEPCTWLFSAGVRSGKKGDGTTCVLHTFQHEHSPGCKGPEGFMNTTIDANWVAKKMEKMVGRHHQTFKARQIIVDIWERFATHITYYTAWHARCKIMEKIHGNYEESYARIPAMCHEMLKRNPGSVAKCRSDPATGEFQSCTIAYGAALRCWPRGCRPLLGLDGCHLKGKYGGVLLAITGLDGNNGLYPLAFMITRSEGYEAWHEFLEIMKPYLEEHLRQLVFISDQQKGLVHVVEQLFPGAYKRFCFRHMYQNFKKDCKGGCAHEKIVWNAARAYKKSTKTYWLDQLKAKKDGMTDGQVYYDWLIARDEDKFCRSHFLTYSKAEHITNNFSESFNKWILKIREKPPCMLVEELLVMVMTLFRKRQLKSRSMDVNGTVPRVKKAFDIHLKKVADFTYSGAEDGKFLVLGIGGSRNLVDLDRQQCDCLAWQLTGIPCIHAANIIAHKRQDWSKYCDEAVSVKKYRLAYNGNVIPLASQEDWEKPEGGVMKPPPHQRPPGRPRKNRRRGADEGPGGPSQDFQQKKVYRCTTCGEPGHNKGSCKGIPAAVMKARKAAQSAAAASPGGSSSSLPTASQGRTFNQAFSAVVGGGFTQPEGGSPSARGCGRGRGRGGRGRSGPASEFQSQTEGTPASPPARGRGRPPLTPGQTRGQGRGQKRGPTQESGESQSSAGPSKRGKGAGPTTEGQSGRESQAGQ